MKTSKFTDEQIAMALRQAEAGTPVGEICRKLGVSEQSFYRWKKRFGALGVSELRELRQFRDENRKLKGLVADLSLDKTILHEALRKKWYGPPSLAPSCTGRGRRTRCPSAGPAAPWGSSDPWSATGAAGPRSNPSGRGCGNSPVCASGPATSDSMCSCGGRGGG